MSVKAIKLFTHNDLDGIGCIIITKLAYPDYVVDYTICDPNPNKPNYIDTELNKVLLSNEVNKYERIIVSDLCYSVDMINSVYNYNEEAKYRKETNISILNPSACIEVYDHHKTNAYFSSKEYSKFMGKFSLYCDDKEEIPTCGTMILCEELIPAIEANESIYQYAEVVRLYDTWDWAKKPDDKYSIIAKRQNMIFNFLTPESYIREMLRILRNYDGASLINAVWSLYFEEIYTNILDKTQKYIDEKVKSMIKLNSVINGRNYTFGYISAEDHQSMIGNAACNMNKDIDFCVIQSGKTFSLRSVKDDIDVSVIASLYGGGGHYHAAGFMISSDIYNIAIKQLWNLISSEKII